MNTFAVKASRLPPHGQFSLAWDGDVLFVTYCNAWNRQAVEQLHEVAKEAWVNPPRRPWAMFSDARNWVGGSQEVFDQWWILYQDAVANGMTKATDVLPSKFHELILKNLIAKAGSIAEYQHHQSMDDAWDWLSCHGFGRADLPNRGNCRQ